MNIIVLGMDNTGKTTLTNMLKDEFGLNLINSTGPKASRKEMVDHILKLKNENQIFERFPFFEEIVYGEVLRGESKFKFESWAYKFIKVASPLIIYCRPSLKTMLDWKDREQMEGVIEKALLLLNKYDEIFIQHIIKDFKYLVWDYKKDDFSKLVSQINHLHLG